MREFAKIFIDDIIIFSRIRKKYLKHLKTIFKRLLLYDVTLNSIKAGCPQGFPVPTEIGTGISFQIPSLARDGTYS